jgi:hypothetical protein
VSLRSGDIHPGCNRFGVGQWRTTRSPHQGGAALETLGKVRTVAFDKTGTLTMGHPQVTDLVVVKVAEADILAKSAAVERGSAIRWERRLSPTADQHVLAAYMREGFF